MTTLNLKRKHTGIYEVENEEILISISNPYSSDRMGSNAWQLVIEDKTNEDKELVNEWFDTKKEASQFGARWVIENL